MHPDSRSLVSYNKTEPGFICDMQMNPGSVLFLADYGENKRFNVAQHARKQGAYILKMKIICEKATKTTQIYYKSCTLTQK